MLYLIKCRCEPRTLCNPMVFHVLFSKMWEYQPRRWTLVKTDTLPRKHDGSAIQQLLQHRFEHFHAFDSIDYTSSSKNSGKRQLKSSRLYGRTQHPKYGWSWKRLPNSVRTLREHTNQLLAKWWNLDSFRRERKDVLQATSSTCQDRNALEVGVDAMFTYPPLRILQKRIPRQHVLPKPKMLQIQAITKGSRILQKAKAFQPDGPNRHLNIAFVRCLKYPVVGPTAEPLQEISFQDSG